jgi:hypothetical protein
MVFSPSLTSTGLIQPSFAYSDEATLWRVDGDPVQGCHVSPLCSLPMPAGLLSPPSLAALPLGPRERCLVLNHIRHHHNSPLTGWPLPLLTLILDYFMPMNVRPVATATTATPSSAHVGDDDDDNDNGDNSSSSSALSSSQTENVTHQI